MDRIADDLVDHAAVVGHDARRDIEIGIEQRHQIGRFGALGHAGEAFDVGEQRGDLAHLAAQAQCAGIGGDAAHHLGRQVLLEAGAQQPCPPFVAHKPHQRAASAKATIATSGGPAGSTSTARPGTAATAAAVQARQHSTARAARGAGRSRAANSRQNRPSNAGADRFREIRPDRPDEHLPRSIASIASAWICTEGVAGEAGVTRSPPSSGRAAADQHDPAGERGAGRLDRRSAVGAGIVRHGRQTRPAAASHRGRAAARIADDAACRLARSAAPGSLCEPDRLDRQARPDDAAGHHQQRNAADRAIGVGCRDQGAEPLRGIGERRQSAPTTPLARQSPGSDTGARDRIGVVGSSCPNWRSPAQTRARTAPPTARAPVHASPSAENRSGPASRISSANAPPGCPAATRQPARPGAGAARARVRSGPAHRGRYRR